MVTMVDRRSDEDVVFVDLNSAPADWHEKIKSYMDSYATSEAQPIADQVKLRACKNVSWSLPTWLRVGR